MGWRPPGQRMKNSEDRAAGEHLDVKRCHNTMTSLADLNPLSVGIE
jgi:hypothetical protein